jgi:hypothetical protein
MRYSSGGGNHLMLRELFGRIFRNTSLGGGGAVTSVKKKHAITTV